MEKTMIQILGIIGMIMCLVVAVYAIVYAVVYVTVGKAKADTFAKEFGKTLFSILRWVGIQILAINDWTGREIARFGARNPRILGLLFFLMVAFTLTVYSFGRFQF